jgi:Zn-finger nucleic acid-binding protein
MPLSHHASADEPDSNAPIKCPKCGKMMAQVQEAGVTIDRCRSCGGIWLDALEMEKILAKRGAADRIDVKAPVIESRTGQKGATLCPRDKSLLIRMVDHDQPHVQYESCKVCGGAFLDSGELRDLSHHTLLERMRHLLGR